MSEYTVLTKRLLKYMLYLLALFTLGWGLTPYPTIFLSLILGTAFSLYKLWFMYRKVDRVGDAIVNQKKLRSLGSLQRIAVSGLAVLIALRFPETFHLISVIVGLMTFYMVILIDFVFQSRIPKQS
jgi:ATP synthase protein I